MFSSFNTFPASANKNFLALKAVLTTPNYIVNTLLTSTNILFCQRYDSFGNLYFGASGIIQAYINNVLTTVAGNGTPGYSGDNGLATSALVGQPRGINFDSSGNIYFGDFTQNAIRKIDILTGIISTIAGNGTSGNGGIGGPATMAQVSAPQDIVFDLSGNMYVTIRGGLVINKIDTNGIMTRIAGTGGNGYSGDNGPATSATFGYPCQLFLNQTTMCLYVTDGGNYAVRQINLNSGIITTVVGNGTSSSTGDGGLATLATLLSSRGITFDKVGNMYISGGPTVRKVDLNGIITTFAGTGTLGNTGDNGIAMLAEFAALSYIDFDPLGNLILGDAYNNNIRKISFNN